jgi:hypothetical protein
MVLAGPCRLPAHTVVRIILPDIRTSVVTTRHRKREESRKITRYLLPAWPGGATPARSPGVILLTFTA